MRRIHAFPIIVEYSVRGVLNKGHGRHLAFNDGVSMIWGSGFRV